MPETVQTSMHHSSLETHAILCIYSGLFSQPLGLKFLINLFAVGLSK